MLTLKVLSALLCYPRAETLQAADEMAAVLDQEAVLGERERSALKSLMAQMQATDLLELQAEYVSLFDRSRSLSLHLFEHVHGESRDRGQAMVDLMELYKRHGFALAARELPDYIPLFLEYLAHRPMDEARELLTDTGHILVLLQARLMERESPYQAVLAALTRLAGAEAELETLRAEAAKEPRDDTPEALDQVWEAEQVTFGPGADGLGAASCPHDAGARGAATVQWYPRKAAGDA